MAAERAADGGNRAAITVCVILATIMQALDTTIANIALPVYPRQRLGQPGPDQLGADLIYRRRGDHDTPDRLPRRAVRTQAPVPRVRGGLHRRLHAVRH